MDNEVLKPCPFCGGHPERFTIGEEEPNNAGGDVIVCTRCQASSHVEFGRKENLVDRWNTRTALTKTEALPAKPVEMEGLVELVEAVDALFMTAEDRITGVSGVALQMLAEAANKARAVLSTLPATEALQSSELERMREALSDEEVEWYAALARPYDLREREAARRALRAIATHPFPAALSSTPDEGQGK